MTTRGRLHYLLSAVTVTQLLYPAFTSQYSPPNESMPRLPISDTAPSGRLNQATHLPAPSIPGKEFNNEPKSDKSDALDTIMKRNALPGRTGSYEVPATLLDKLQKREYTNGQDDPRYDAAVAEIMANFERMHIMMEEGLRSRQKAKQRVNTLSRHTGSKSRSSYHSFVRIGKRGEKLAGDDYFGTGSISGNTTVGDRRAESDNHSCDDGGDVGSESGQSSTYLHINRGTGNEPAKDDLRDQIKSFSGNDSSTAHDMSQDLGKTFYGSPPTPHAKSEIKKLYSHDLKQILSNSKHKSGSTSNLIRQIVGLNKQRHGTRVKRNASVNKRYHKFVRIGRSSSKSTVPAKRSNVFKFAVSSDREHPSVNAGTVHTVEEQHFTKQVGKEIAKLDQILAKWLGRESPEKFGLRAAQLLKLSTFNSQPIEKSAQ